MEDGRSPREGTGPSTLTKKLFGHRWAGDILAELAAAPHGLRKAALGRAITLAAHEYIMDVQLHRTLSWLKKLELIRIEDDQGTKLYKLTPSGHEQHDLLQQLANVRSPAPPPAGGDNTSRDPHRQAPSGVASPGSRTATPDGASRPSAPLERGMTDPTPPTAAGMYDYYLGGTAHSPADRAAAERIAELIPDIADSAWANRGFLQRAVTHLTTQWGIRQFIDIGSGLPTQYNTHDVVAEATPDGRTIYVDNDPTVVARAREILTSTQAASVIHGDVREPGAILDHPETRRLIDLTQPVGLLLIAVLHFVPDDDDPWALIGRYRDRLATGSYMAVSHPSVGHQITDQVRAKSSQAIASMATQPTDRSRTEIERFFNGMEIIPPYPEAEPEPVHIGLWGAEDPEYADSEGSRMGYAAVARIP